LITKLMKTFNKIKKFSGYLDYNIEETVLNFYKSFSWLDGSHDKFGTGFYFPQILSTIFRLAFITP
ncbi:hypothetical protein, partial [Bacteroides gallinaceum]|uniref:hypothetical protein n=1 Tax=Bacteroides gallinaceum TaxID=1462571 RepID=UPI00195A7DBF